MIGLPSFLTITLACKRIAKRLWFVPFLVCTIVAQENLTELSERTLRQAEIYLREGQVNQAEQELQKLLALLPPVHTSYRTAAYRNLGLIYLRQEKADQAISVFQKALSLDPTQGDLHYDLGVSLTHKERHQEAIVHFKRAYSLGLKHAPILLDLARAEFTTGQISRALKRIDEIRTIYPSEAHILRETGLLLFQNLFYERAQQVLHAALILEPSSYEIAFYLALVNFVMEEFVASRELLEESVEKGMVSVDLYNLLGSVYAKLGQFEKSIASFQVAMQHDADRADAYLNLALVYLELREVDQVEELLQQLIPLANNRELKIFYSLTGASCQNLLHQEQEKSSLVQSDHAKADYYLKVATLFQDRDHYTTALELLKIARKYEPSSARISFALGLSCFNLEPWSTGARDMFQKAVELQPDFDKAHYFLGEAYAYSGKHAAATEAYMKAIELNPRSAPYYYGLAKVLIKQNRSAFAMNLLRKAVELNPSHAPSYHEWGRIYLRLGDYRRAIDKLEKAVKCEPEFFTSYYLLGRAYGRIGQRKKAKELFRVFETKKKLAGERARIDGGLPR